MNARNKRDHKVVRVRAFSRLVPFEGPISGCYPNEDHLPTTECRRKCAGSLRSTTPFQLEVPPHARREPLKTPPAYWSSLLRVPGSIFRPCYPPCYAQID